METIKKIWFENNRMYMLSSADKVYSRPLEAFPRLLDATDKQRNAYEIGNFGDDLRWEDIDEDIHISSFFTEQEPEYNNPIAQIFERFPELNVSQVAGSIGINKSLMAQYIYGIKTPSPARTEQIKNTLRSIGKELIAV